jgi:hypothetical protein
MGITDRQNSHFISAQSLSLGKVPQCVTPAHPQSWKWKWALAFWYIMEDAYPNLQISKRFGPHSFGQ